jgi:hypothetical protein
MYDMDTELQMARVVEVVAHLFSIFEPVLRSDESFTVAFLGSKILREEQRGRRRWTTTAAAAAPHL